MKYPDLIVPDTNIFINGLFKRQTYPLDYKLLMMASEKNIKFIFSRYTLNELYKIMCRQVEASRLFECSLLFQFLNEIVNNSNIIEEVPLTDIVSTDRSDQNFLDLAVFMRCKYLITNDTNNNLLDIRSHKKVLIITPQEYFNC
jgi:putative PIN family toxin of toxin-antitoxin system